MPRELARLHFRGSLLRLTTTEDDSPTRLELCTHVRFSPQPATVSELEVADVQELVRALLGWLADQGHELPKLSWSAGP
jgi:hypothetical protein